MSITNLTGTTWTFKTIIDFSELSGQSFNLSGHVACPKYGGVSHRDTGYSNGFTGLRMLTDKVSIVGGDGVVYYRYDATNHWTYDSNKIGAPRLVIGGGTDVSNAVLIEWLEENAYMAPFPTVTDLTNTRWYMQSHPGNAPAALSVYGSFNINFTSNSTNYSSLTIGQLTGTNISVALTYGSTSAKTTDAWAGASYRWIEITGGADATNANLILWLKCNAHLMDITDLTGTKWVLYDWPMLWVTNGVYGAPAAFSPYQYELTFTADGTTYREFEFTSSTKVLTSVSYYQTVAGTAEQQYSYGASQVNPVGWTDASMQTIAITGGAAANSTDFICWLRDNAVQIIPTRLSIDLEDLAAWESASSGSHSITLKAKATGYRTSRASEAVTVSKGTVAYTVSITTGSYADAPYTIYDGDSTSGVEIASISSNSSVHVLIESGYMTILGAASYGAASNTGTCSGGVVFDQWLDSRTARYIVSGAGTVSGVNWGCFVGGTPILLADGTTKPVEDITYDDDLLVWNFYEGKLDHAKPCWIMEEKVATQYKKVTLSNGIVLKLVGAGDNCHRLYNVTKQKMLYANECVGDEVYTLKGIATVLSCEKVNETVKYYNLTTEKYLDCFANEVLTGSRLNNMYNIENMKYTDDKRLISEAEEAERWAVRAAIKKEV